MALDSLNTYAPKLPGTPILIGVMTNPALSLWRKELRYMLRVQQKEGQPSLASFRFVVGALNQCSSSILISLQCNGSHPMSCGVIAGEQQRHGDIVTLTRALECSTRCQPAAEKT
jgi:hypothetical protein